MTTNLAAGAWVRTVERDVRFEELFHAQYASVVGIAYRVLGDSSEAEDVAQDVFYSFYRSHQPDAPYAAAWLHRAAAHTALDVIRGRQRRRRREERQAVEHERVHTSMQAALDPQHEVVAREQRQEVRAALARLPRKSATVLTLRYSGLSYAEVAAALNVKIGQVGTLLRRAETALHKEMIDDAHR
jgi:RNA polymerase sigma factor (sigma-70 family)